jgi:hypothetical protein
MAVAIKHTVEIKPERIIPAVIEKRVTLLLSEEETQFLIDVMSRISGSRDNSRRKYANDILRVLTAIGFTFNETDISQGMAFV